MASCTPFSARWLQLTGLWMGTGFFLKLMVAEAWQQTICARLAHRKDFNGLPTINVAVSFGSFRTNDKAKAELIGTIQDGTFCTKNIFAKFDPEKPATCVHCGQLNDLRHRCLHCPVLAGVRQQHGDAVGEWQHAPRAFTDHALVSRNPVLLDYCRNLLMLESILERFLVQPCHGGYHHVFTDGSCLEPRSKIKALVAWAVVDMSSIMVISTGLVPSLVQSSDGAELLAVHSALLWALLFAVTACIHFDSSYVVDGLRVIHHLLAVPSKWKHQPFGSRFLML